MTLLPEVPLVALFLVVLGLLAFCAWRIWDDRKHTLAWIRRGVMVLLMAAMLCHPGVPGQLVPTGKVSGKVIIMIDTSQSMAATDFDRAARFEGVKEDVKSIAYAFAGADIGVITFNHTAQVNVPLTSDGSAVIEMVRALQPELALTSRGSSIGAGRDLLLQEVERLRAKDAGAPILVFYLGDGEQTSADAVESFSDVRQHISGGFVLGYGTPEGGTMPKSTYTGYSDELVEDPATGSPAISKLDEGNLRQIASEMGIEYLQRTAGSSLTPIIQGLSAGDAELTFDQLKESRLDIYWAFAYPLAALLAWEGFHIAREIRRTVPKRRAA